MIFLEAKLLRGHLILRELIPEMLEQTATEARVRARETTDPRTTTRASATIAQLIRWSWFLINLDNYVH